jgi:uncharacterized membrane protein YhaH (DUF805 family)
MSWMHYLFGFRGRLNRAKYWLFVLIYTVALTVLLAIGGTFLFTGAVQGGLAGAAAGGLVFMILTLVFVLLALIASIAVGVKRLHDRNRSGWWLLLFFFVPGLLMGIGEALNPAPEFSATDAVFLLLALVLGIWGFLELAVLRGTVGDNRYGPDPVAKPAETAAAFE